MYVPPPKVAEFLVLALPTTGKNVENLKIIAGVCRRVGPLDIIFNHLQKTSKYRERNRQMELRRLILPTFCQDNPLPVSANKL